MDSTRSGQKKTPWQFAIVNRATAATPQTVQAFNGQTWTTLGSLGAVVSVRTYVPLTVSATATAATLTVNGQSFTPTSGPPLLTLSMAHLHHRRPVRIRRHLLPGRRDITG